MSAELLVSAAAWFVASFVGGLCGIGAAAIATAMQILVMPVQKVVLVSCLTALGLGTAMALRYGRQCRWKTALLLFAGALPGSWAGLFVLAHASSTTLEVVVGVMLVFCTVGMALFRKAAFLKESAAASLVVGFAGGALGTSVNIDGPVVALYGLQAGWSPMVFLGTTSVYFALRLVLTCTCRPRPASTRRTCSSSPLSACPFPWPVSPWPCPLSKEFASTCFAAWSRPSSCLPACCAWGGRSSEPPAGCCRVCQARGRPFGHARAQLQTCLLSAACCCIRL